MTFLAPVGVSDLLSLRGEGSTYVDKTATVASVIEHGAAVTPVTLFTRPRRFGKTLLLSTFEAFLQRAEVTGRDTTSLFEDLEVIQAGWRWWTCSGEVLSDR